MRPYIDCHNHIGRTIDRVPPVGQNTAMCLARFAETDIYASITAPTAVGSPITRGIVDIREQNEVVARACRCYPDRFPISLALIESRFGKLGIEEADRAIVDLGMTGIVGHPPIGEWVIPFVEVAAAHKGLCNLHMHNPLMTEIARMFPETTFIVHCSTFAIENFASADNIWYEIVQYPDGPQSVWDFPTIVDKVGRERILFGADLPYYDYRVLQNTIETADIDDDLKDRIAFKNAASLIRQFKPDWEIPDGPIRTPRVYDPALLWKKNPDNEVRLAVYA